MSIALHIIRMPLASIAAIALSGAAAAQTVAGPPPGAAPPPERHSLTIGIGGGIGPDYEGSNETSFQPGGVVQGQVDGFDFQVRGTNLYVDLLRDAPRARTALTLGPVVQVRLERTGKIRDPRVAALGDRKTAVELGAYAGVSQRGVLNRYDSVNVELAFLHDVAGAHRSFLLTPSVSYSTPLSRRTFARAIVSADYVGEGYGRTYFDVTPAGAAASGLAPYTVSGSGFKSAGLTGLVVQDLGGDGRKGLGLFALAGYKRMLGQYADSPIVRDAGSANQGFAVAGLTYSF